MKIESKARKMCECNRCGHVWMQNMRTVPDDPNTCARCCSPYWNKPRKRGVKPEV